MSNTTPLTKDKQFRSRKRSPLPRWLNVVLGILLIIIGLLGLVLPILQGVLFLAAGLLLLSEAIPSLRRHVDKLERRSKLLNRALSSFRTSDGTVRLGKLIGTVTIVTAIAIGVGLLLKWWYQGHG
ncbi:MAG: hypothetical protein ABI444_10880 [Candidatus Kapaibacterium sp.]|jgi:uncharacterized membrane protein YbaN (DUF454 family)